MCSLPLLLFRGTKQVDTFIKTTEPPDGDVSIGGSTDLWRKGHCYRRNGIQSFNVCFPLEMKHIR